ncbi:MAG: hypothetical protein ACJ8NS_04820 [Chthoniobacterales bacterium]
MRRLAIVLLFLVGQTCLAARQKPLPERPANTFTAFALLVGEFYFFHHAWPTSERQFREFAAQLARKFPRDSQEIMPTVLSYMRHIEFTPRGKDVLLSARFHEDGRDYTYAAILHPGHSAEEIANRMTPQ